MHTKVDNRLILALAAQVKLEVPSAGRHRNALFAFDSHSSSLHYNVCMLNINIQRRSSSRMKVIQSSADKAILTESSKYSNIK